MLLGSAALALISAGAYSLGSQAMYQDCTLRHQNALQDFKTAHLLGVCPRAQFLAMLLGSAASALVSVGAYSLYTSAWPVPGPEFPAPTAEIWLDMADLVSDSVLILLTLKRLL